MAGPLQTELHVDTLLGNVSVKYRNTEYIADQVFPFVDVNKESDLYRIYERNFRIPETRRNTKSAAREHDFHVSTATYMLVRNALKGYVADRDADNYDLADLRADTTEELTDALLRRMELDVATLFTTTSWSLNVSLAATTAFNANTTLSNPIPVFDTGAATVIANSGKRPNFGIMNFEAFIACKNHTSVLDRTKYTSADMDVGMIASLLGLSQLLVPLASQDTAIEGASTGAAIAAIWGDSAFLGYKPANPGPLQASAGYIFRKSMPLVKRWRDEDRESDAIEVNLEYNAKVVASLAGYLIKDVI